MKAFKAKNTSTQARSIRKIEMLQNLSMLAMIVMGLGAGGLVLYCLF